MPAPPGGTPGGCLSSRLKEPASYRSLAGEPIASPSLRQRRWPAGGVRRCVISTRDCVSNTRAGGGVILAPHSVTQLGSQKLGVGETI